MGIAVFAALSDGSSIAPGNYGKKALRALRTAQRSLSRKRQGSSNRRKAVRRVARVQQRVANARKDFLHKHSTAIAKSHGTVVVEALSVRSMSASAAGTSAAPGRNVRQKSGLNRAILDQGWRTFTGLQVGRAGRTANRSASRLHQPNMRSLRRDRRRQSPRSGAFRLCRVRTSSRCRR